MPNVKTRSQERRGKEKERGGKVGTWNQTQFINWSGMSIKCKAKVEVGGLDRLIRVGKRARKFGGGEELGCGIKIVRKGKRRKRLEAALNHGALIGFIPITTKRVQGLRPWNENN